jgi:hypothetical protein
MGIDATPVGKGASTATERAIDMAWTLAKAHGASNLLDDWQESFQTRVEKLQARHADLVRRQRYDMSHLLYEAGFPASAPPTQLVDPATGHLKSYDDLLKEAERAAGGDVDKVLREKLTVYEHWTDANGPLDEKVEDAARLSTNKQAQELIELWAGARGSS